MTDPWVHLAEEEKIRRRLAEIRSERALALESLTDDELVEAARRRPGCRDVDHEVCRRFAEKLRATRGSCPRGEICEEH